MRKGNSEKVKRDCRLKIKRDQDAIMELSNGVLQFEDPISKN